MKQIASILLIIFMTGPFGCATGKQTGALSGGAIGAGVGAAVAQGTKKNPLVGALIGGAVGLVAGALIGDYIDEQNKNRQESVRATDYRPTQGNVVTISETSNDPIRVKPGEKVGLKSTYYLMSPSPEAQVKIVETRVIQYNGATIMDPLVRHLDKQQGQHSSTMKIPIPDDSPEGEYTVITTVDNGTRKDQSISKFYVQKI